MHLLIFWGVFIQVIGTAIKIMQMGLFVPFTWPLFSEGVYFAYELVMDLAGAAILLGVIMALFRRLVIRPDYIENSWDDIYALVLLACIPLVGFFTEGLRIFVWNPDWAAWSPIGNWVAALLTKYCPDPFSGDLNPSLYLYCSCWAGFIDHCQYSVHKNAPYDLHSDPYLPEIRTAQR